MDSDVLVTWAHALHQALRITTIFAFTQSITELGLSRERRLTPLKRRLRGTFSVVVKSLAFSHAEVPIHEKCDR